MVGVSSVYLSYLSLLAIISCSRSISYVKNSNRFKAISWGLPLAGHKLNIVSLASVTARNRYHCISQCTKTEGCISINVGPKIGEEHVCELLREDRYIMVLNMTVEAGWTYVGIKTKCDKNPCAANNLCVPDYNSDNYNCIGPEDNNCQRLLDKGIVSSGLFLVNVADTYAPVYCDQTTDGGGWLVIQRKELAEDFSKTWEEYKKGFGNLLGSFWWGNEKIHELSSSGKYDLRIDVKTSTGLTGYGKYAMFKLSNEQDNYRLNLNATSFTGDIGDSLSGDTVNSQLIGKEFTTIDKDNDICNCNCATEGGGAWWYGHCARGNLNSNTFEWRSWSSYPRIRVSEIKIRPASLSV